ncbi:MAG: carbohydrate ABC transporter permease, partial [Acetatifactor sp.]|nr:carbohydrate ABC transporter permease [Acetatifactor sp.]
MKSDPLNKLRTVFAHILLVFLSFMCLFFFYILFVNASRSHADLMKGFTVLPGKYFFANLKSVANDGTFPMMRGILNSLIDSGSSAAI